jgi:hypothetical protein
VLLTVNVTAPVGAVGPVYDTLAVRDAVSVPYTMLREPTLTCAGIAGATVIWTVFVTVV